MQIKVCIAKSNFPQYYWKNARTQNKYRFWMLIFRTQFFSVSENVLKIYFVEKVLALNNYLFLKENVFSYEMFSVFFLPVLQYHRMGIYDLLQI